MVPVFPLAITSVTDLTLWLPCCDTVFWTHQTCPSNSSCWSNKNPSAGRQHLTLAVSPLGKALTLHLLTQQGLNSCRTLNSSAGIARSVWNPLLSGCCGPSLWGSYFWEEPLLQPTRSKEDTALVCGLQTKWNANKHEMGHNSWGSKALTRDSQLEKVSDLGFYLESSLPVQEEQSYSRFWFPSICEVGLRHAFTPSSHDCSDVVLL